MVSKTTCKSVFLSRYKNISLSRGKFLKILNFKFLNLIVKRNLENSLYFHSASKWKSIATFFDIFFFFKFSFVGKNSKISHILVFCMLHGKKGRRHDIDFLFYFLLLAPVVGEILARLEINSSLFSFHPVGKLDWKFY